MSSHLRSTRPWLVAAMAVACLAALPAGAGAKSVVKGPKGPANDGFYAPTPAQIAAGKPGSVIWQREIKYSKSGRVALKAAGKSILVMYRSKDPKGKPIAVSGVVEVPKGRAPKGGWKTISWAHGTTGVADSCAPSRTRAGSPADGYIAYASATADGWLKAGYAVARTDYEGLGTDGEHRFLVGRSEGRSVVDMALAARAVFRPGTLSKDYVIGGHSQGGQAALFAASQAAGDAPGLKLKGVFAYAPASHIYDQRVAIGGLGEKSSGLTGLAVMILDSAAREAGVDTESLVTDKVAKLLGVLKSGCSPEITKAFSKIAPRDILKPGADMTAVDKVLKAMNPDVKIPVSVLVLQGSFDQTVFSVFTKNLVRELDGKGNEVEFAQFNGLTHSTIVTDKAPTKKVLEFLRARLGR